MEINFDQIKKISTILINSSRLDAVNASIYPSFLQLLIEMEKLDHAEPQNCFLLLHVLHDEVETN